MKKIQFLSLLILSAGLFFSCSSHKIAMDELEGTYVGTLPCADCPGIRQELTINSDKTYTLSVKYLDRDEVPVRHLKGKFTIKDSIITLLQPSDGGKYYYKIEKGVVRYLGADKKPFTGKLAKMYILKRGAALDTTSTTKKSITWDKKYFGVLPCADCAGINYELFLKNDENYQLVTHYLAKDSKYDTVSGSIVWNDDKTIATLKGVPAGKKSQQFKIDKVHAYYLNIDGKEVTGKLADKYILEREGNLKVEDKKWNLITLNGDTIADTNTNNFFIQFHSKDNQVEVKANCNLISLNYRLLANNQLQFKQGLSTLMACKNSKDKEMMAVMYKVVTFSLDKNKMLFNNMKGDVIAVFERE